MGEDTSPLLTKLIKNRQLRFLTLNILDVTVTILWQK
jgi:hypothetical protein